jgi:hypothetical protein
MTLTNLMSCNGACVAHSLDFDIVAVDATEEAAWNKLSLAVKTYVEFGLSQGWSEFIMHEAPQEFWDELTPSTPVKIMPPLEIADGERKAIVARPPHEALRPAS